jgi:hypothetical protein
MKICWLNDLLRTEVTSSGPLLPGWCTTQDVDIFLRHMNDARYLRELDFARFHFYDRTNLYSEVIKMKGNALQSASSIRYRRTIPIFSLYKVHTKVSFVKPRCFPSIRSFSQWCV